MIGIFSISDISDVDAQQQQENTTTITNTTEVKNWYFQIEVPNNWICEEYSNSPATVSNNIRNICCS